MRPCCHWASCLTNRLRSKKGIHCLCTAFTILHAELNISSIKASFITRHSSKHHSHQKDFQLFHSIFSTNLKSFIMQITAVALLFCAAMGAVATPVESVSDGIDARAEPAALILHEGVSIHEHSIPWVFIHKLPLTTWNNQLEMHQSQE